MRRDQERLRDVVEALESVSKLIQGKTMDDFVADDAVCYAVAQRLTVVGEAISRISPEVQERHPDVPWKRIISFRNVLIHEYFGIHWPFVWTTATEHAPKLKEQILAILQAEFPEE